VLKYGSFETLLSYLKLLEINIGFRGVEPENCCDMLKISNPTPELVHPVGHFLPLVNGSLPFINRLLMANGGLDTSGRS
jgi:hypothetical protein